VLGVKAIVLRRGSATPGLETIVRRAPIGREVAVEVTYAGICSCDLVFSDSSGVSAVVLGRDFAGTVSGIGPDDEGEFALGDRVAGVASRFGSFAETTLVDARSGGELLVKIPRGIGDDTAAALPTDGLAALAALEHLAPCADTTLLIVGATGSIGSIALQLGRRRRARMIAAVRRSPGDAWALGASSVVVTSEIDVLEGVRLIHPRGVDGVLDLVGTSADAAYRLIGAVRPGGTFVSAGGVADVAAFARRGVTAINLPDRGAGRGEDLERLIALAASGQLVLTIAREISLAEVPPVLTRHPLDRVPGKSVCRLRSPGRDGQ
jgi:NADPH:quinone reductase